MPLGFAPISATPISGQSPATVATVAVSSKSGSKFGKPYKPPVDPWLENQRADQNYWDVRERYLRRFLEPVLKQEPASAETRESSPIKVHEAQTNELEKGQSHLRLLIQARDAVVTQAREAANEAELRQHTARVLKLTLDISALRVQYYERAAILLLLDIF